ncbi:MAG TPA: transposase zinc-binding domain-containing protein [Acidisarcina sp.]
MTGHRLEVADVFHAHQSQFLQRWGHIVSDQQRKVLRDIGRCRTAALGTHLERCDRCDYETVAYDSCRNRHCPKCQSSTRDEIKSGEKGVTVRFSQFMIVADLICLIRGRAVPAA